MAHLITSPEKFAAEVNARLPGAHRQISTHDVRDMVTCGLIGRYGYFINLDLETVRAIVKYEQLRENRQKREEIKDDDGVIHCRRSGVVLTRPEGKRGRPNEFCDKYQPFRGRERQRKWRQRQATPDVKTRNGLVTAAVSFGQGGFSCQMRR